MATLAVKRKETTPPDGYVCHKCNESGHWIQQCPLKDANDGSHKRRKKSDHVPIAGVDPSQADIDAAREMQKIPPPNCFCGIPSRLKKVKRSNVGGDSSRALGKYFFFCSKKKGDDTACRFARPVEDELMDKKDRICTFWAKNGSCKKGDKCMFSHDAPPGKARPRSDAKKDAAKKKSPANTDDTEAKKKKKDEDSDADDTSSSSDSSSLPSSSDSDDDISSSSDDDSSDNDSSSDSSNSSDDSSSDSDNNDDSSSSSSS